MIRRSPFIPLDSYSKYVEIEQRQCLSPCKETGDWNTPIQTRNQMRKNNELLQSPSFFINSGAKYQAYSNNRRSSVVQKLKTNINSFKKIDDLEVREFDNQFPCDQSGQWIQSQQRRMRFFMQPSQASTAKLHTTNNITYFPECASSQQQMKSGKGSQSKDDSFLLSEKLALVQKHMMQLHASIEDLEFQFREMKINDQLGFLKNPHQRDIQINQKILVQEKFEHNEDEVPFRVFYPNTTCENTLVFGNPNSQDAYQLSFMQQKISDMISHISQFLQRSSGLKVKLENQQEHNQEVQVFTYNKASSKFIRVYKCKFCEAKFGKACSLGYQYDQQQFLSGHISRVHKEESQRMKILMKPIRKNQLNKQRKDIILKNINRNVYRL